MSNPVSDYRGDTSVHSLKMSFPDNKLQVYTVQLPQCDLKSVA